MNNEIEWENGKGDRLKAGSWAQDGFNFTVELIHDTDHSWGVGESPEDFRGYFTDTWGEGCFSNPAHKKNPAGTPRYFVPAYSLVERVYDLAKTESKEDAFRLATEQIDQDMRIAADPEGEGYIAIGVSVTVRFREVELAKSSMWGTEIEAKPDIEKDPYVLGLIEEQVDDALTEAKKKLAQLRA